MINIISEINKKIITHMINLGEKMELGEMDLTGAVDNTLTMVHE